MQITLYNDYHRTEARVRVAELPARLSETQVRRVRRTLCGMSDCVCGGPLGERGPQDVQVVYMSGEPMDIGLVEQ